MTDPAPFTQGDITVITGKTLTGGTDGKHF